MPLVDPRPFSSARFLVDIGAGDPHAASAGFSEVVFPRLDAGDPAPGAAPPRLILRRGVTGALDVVQWWKAARRGEAPQRRTVTVTLFDETGRPVFAWRFRDARPASLTYSPLVAAASGFLVETLEVAFDAVEIG